MHGRPVPGRRHRAAWVSGDEVYGGNLKLRSALEESGTGNVLAVACSHEATTNAGKFRADTLAKKVPKRAWQKPSAGTEPRATASMTGPSSTSPTPIPAAVNC